MLYRLYSNDSNKEFSWQKVGDKPLFGQTCGPGSFPPRDIYIKLVLSEDSFI
jgi:hypothetical protein